MAFYQVWACVTYAITSLMRTVKFEVLQPYKQEDAICYSDCSFTPEFQARIFSPHIFSILIYVGIKMFTFTYFTRFTCYPFILMLPINVLCFCLYSRCALMVVSVFLGFFITLTFNRSVIAQLCYIPNTARWWKYKEDTNRPALKVIAF